jgi:hypothetical protein
VPAIHVVTVPTELLVTTGAPHGVPLPPTQLSYIGNTKGRVFQQLGDQFIWESTTPGAYGALVIG